MIAPELVTWLAVAAIVVALLSLIVALLAAVRGGRAGRRGGEALEGATPGLEQEIARIDDRLARELSAVAARVSAAEEQDRLSLQRVGIVRFNPFPDTGSNQSFALAVLDARGDGFVVSSLHSRQATRLFLKSVSGGRSETALSEEEAEAIRIAGSK